MRPRPLEAVAVAVGGTVAGDAGACVSGVAVDSRRVRPGDLFVALPGERSDGHDHVGAAFDAGASGALVARGRVADGPGPLVEVDDPGRALLDLATDERASSSAAVVGITGSTGKTCTKDFTSAVLSTRFRAVASVASFNNEVGLPLTLLAASEDTEVVVCEMGSRGPGHITLLCDVARPDLGIVTNVGVAHLELFGSPEALRDAKAELPEALPLSGTAILNADDPVVRAFASRTRARVLLFGTARDAAVRAADVELDRATGAASFRLVTPAGEAPVRLGVPGEHLVPDALAAAAAASTLGVPIEEIARALAEARLSGGRMEVFDAPGGFRVLDDSYNANPTSMAAALRAARWMAGDARCVAVLGRMAELGPIQDEEHERIGELGARLHIDTLVLVGSAARRIALGAQREGVEPERILTCEGPADAVAAVRAIARPGDLVLIKASRAEGLERVSAALRAPLERPAVHAAEAAR